MFHSILHPPASNKIDGDESCSQYIAQEFPLALEPLNDENSLETFEIQSSPTLYIEESALMISFDNSSYLTSTPNSAIAFESSAISSTVELLLVWDWIMQSLRAKSQVNSLEFLK
ncbi:hypothetical protein O181_086211 [Austropuccinia psidii MF-1]|uniref:Uncharacterized protein n=1 Tax=Austropuccinia psidii MF-1 TaxID=1389203 RepID=A0A9Q3FUF6_9BASI|nr:hypothetical protein [Austropuccinia psidii MF-1]